MTNKKIIEVYNMGWTDSSNSESKKNVHKAFDDSILQKAYNLGWSDFIVGDDVSEIDKQSDKQIIKKIKSL